MKIAYFGLDLGMGVLKALIAHGHEVVSVHYALDERERNSHLADLARTESIPVSGQKPTADALGAIARQNIDFLLVNGYPHRLPISSTTLKGVNMHPTLLPEGRGPWPFPWIILKALTQTGITTHKMVDAIDAGDILMQTTYPVDETDTLDTLVAKYQLAAPKHILELVAGFDEFWNCAQPQREGSTWPTTTINDGALDWTSDIAELTRKVRAFGSEGCHAVLKGASIRIKAVDSWKDVPHKSPGTIISETAPALVVAAADGYLLLRDYVWE